MVRVTLLLTIALAGMTGCAETVLPQSYLGTVLGPKAAFDLQCPADQLQFANLGPPDMDLLPETESKWVKVNGGVASQQGVTGCGRRGRYIFDRTHMEWILNADSQTAAPASAPPK